MPDLPFDPIERSKIVEKIVIQASGRKYYRFRPARYYGGIATADLLGCPFLCAYCWNYGRNLFPEKSRDRYYSSGEVAERLLSILRKKHFNKVRLSGAEPILGELSFDHFYEILKRISEKNPWVDFILETNGLLIGYEPLFAERLSEFKRLHVRVSLKGFDEESFEAISGAEREFFRLPLKGLRELIRRDVNAWPAIMYETFGPEGIGKLNEKLRQYEIRPDELEIEYLEPYPFVLENLKNRGIRYIHEG